jgi:hypothetical protein
MPAILSQEQVARYDRDGYLLISGLIAEEVAAKAEAAMWRCVGATPDDPASWQSARGGICLFNDPEIANCYTPQFLAAAAQLTREDPTTFSKCATHPKTYCAPDYLEAQAAGEDLTRFFKWHCVYAINLYPTAGEWTWPGPHVDHSIEEHHHKTHPSVFRIGTLTYLNDVPPHGGGTVAWPGSHCKLEALAQSDPARYEYRHTLNEAVGQLPLGDAVELTPRRGDVLFLHHLCAHGGSMNVGHRPRFALNMKW